MLTTLESFIFSLALIKHNIYFSKFFLVSWNGWQTFGYIIKKVRRNKWNASEIDIIHIQIKNVYTCDCNYSIYASLKSNEIKMNNISKINVIRDNLRRKLSDLKNENQ